MAEASTSPSPQPPIGIDLGTTYSCVAVFRNGTVEIIPDEDGNRTIPSYVAFTDTERIVGFRAKEQVDSNPTNTVYDAKRLIGRRYDYQTVQEDIKHWPFEIVDDKGKPKISVNYKGEAKTFYPEEISSMILGKMKEISEQYLGTNISRAVVTVPAYFNDSQRQATKDAGTIAGLDVQRIVNEPTAAAVAYGLDKKDGNEHYVLVYDMGGGTLDVSILLINNGVFEVISTAGNTHLGGEDFDNRLVEYFSSQFFIDHNIDITDNKIALRRLKTVCEQAKRTLSEETVAKVEIDAFVNSVDFSATITREQFEELILDILVEALEPIHKALFDAKISKRKIEDIVLVGGSTRIPKIQSLLQGMFEGKELNKSINPDEAVAHGAAIQAAILAADSDVVRDLLLLDVAPLSLGIETAGGIMTTIINRNTTLPVTCSQIFSTFVDNQSVATIQVYEGERFMTSDNNLLGKFDLTGIPPAPKGVPEIEVTFELDVNGILTVTATENRTGIRNNITINNDKGRLTKEQIEEMVLEAEKYKEQDQQTRAAVAAKRDLEAYVQDMKKLVTTSPLSIGISNSDVNKVLEACNDVKTWLDSHGNETERDYVLKQKEIEDICRPIALRLFIPNIDNIQTDNTDNNNTNIVNDNNNNTPDSS